MDIDKPSAKGEISDQVAKLHSNLQETKELISKLSARLSPVVRPDNPHTIDEKEDTIPKTSTSLGNELRQIVEFVSEENDRIRSILSRIEM